MGLGMGMGMGLGMGMGMGMGLGLGLGMGMGMGMGMGLGMDLGMGMGMGLGLDLGKTFLFPSSTLSTKNAWGCVDRLGEGRNPPISLLWHIGYFIERGWEPMGNKWKIIGEKTKDFTGKGEEKYIAGYELSVVKWQETQTGFYPFADSPENCGHSMGGLAACE